MNVLVQALVEGYGGRARGRSSGAAPAIATPAAHLPTAKPFDTAQFDELAGLMGGVTIVNAVKP